MIKNIMVRAEGLHQRITRLIPFDYKDFPSTDAVEICKIPADAILVGAYIQMSTASQASATLELENGTDTLLSASAISSTTAVGGELDNCVPVGEPQVITATASVALTVGEGVIRIEYVRLGQTFGTHS